MNLRYLVLLVRYGAQLTGDIACSLY